MNLIDQQAEEFIPRHIGTIGDEKEMLETIGEESLDVLINKTIPASIRLEARLSVPDAMSENDYLSLVKDMSLKNILYKSYIGQGYYGTITPSVILRNVFENPGWYTQYTP
ncbi:MAG: glycine dehydrogenase (aminomethyl-transferring), partial [Chitinophagaceae bacterium]